MVHQRPHEEYVKRRTLLLFFELFLAETLYISSSASLLCSYSRLCACQLEDVSECSNTYCTHGRTSKVDGLSLSAASSLDSRLRSETVLRKHGASKQRFQQESPGHESLEGHSETISSNGNGRAAFSVRKTQVSQFRD